MKNKNKLKSVTGYSQFGMLIALVVLVLAAFAATPSLLKADAFAELIANNSVYAILAVGISFVMISGEIDISVGATLALSGVAVTMLSVKFPELPGAVLILAGIFIGCICGFINGIFVGKLKISSLIVTLGTMYIFRGVAYVLNGGHWYFRKEFSKKFTALAQTKLIGIRAIVWWAVLCFVIAGLFLIYYKPGRRFYAVGTNCHSARISGIDDGFVKLMAFVLSGALAGFAGVLYSANYAMVNSDIGNGYEMTAIAICILGGVSITGGKGRMDGILIAAMVMSVINGITGLLPGMSIWQSVLQGGIILVAVVINLTNNRLAYKHALKERGRRI